MAATPRSSKRMVSGQTAENCVFVVLCCILAETLNGHRHPEDEGSVVQRTERRVKPGAPNETILAKYLEYHFLFSWIVSELFKGIFV